MPQLDGLRACAVLIVILAHCGPAIQNDFLLGLPLDYAAIQVFFTLSAFLITRILLRCRSHMEKGQSLGATLKAFYARRTLRIFPLYYGFLLVGILTNYGNGRELAPWLLTYTYNIYGSITGNWGYHYGHFWTLSVEEQFYLLWPLAVLVPPRRLLPWLCGALIAGAAAFRLAMVLLEVPYFPSFFGLPITNMDALGFGALLAVWREVRQPLFRELEGKRWIFGALGALALFLLLWGGSRGHIALLGESSYLILGGTFWGMTGLWLIHRLSQGVGGPAGWFLQARPMVYLGRISYGIYVYHFLVPFLLGPVYIGFFVDELKWPWHLYEAMLTLTCLGFSVAAASLSWHFFEGPLNSLKRYFPYRVTTPPRP